MKIRLRLFLLPGLLICAQLFSQNFTISGTLTDSLTGEPLTEQGVDFNKMTEDGGFVWVGQVQTDANGYFEKTNCTDSTTYQLEYAPYGPLQEINGNYYFPKKFPDLVTINGSDVTGVELKLKPHPADYRLSGGIYSTETQELITGYNFSVYSRMEGQWLNIYSFSSDDGTYITDSMPAGTYKVTVYGNEFYYDLEQTIEIEEGGPSVIEDFDFYLQQKQGAPVSGYLRDMETNNPIAGRDMRCKLGPNERYYTTTDDNGYFEFPNVLPGTAFINAYPEDTAYWYGEDGYYSKEVTVTVTAEGVSDITVFMEQWEQKSFVTADVSEFMPGQQITLNLVIDNNYDVPYACFALQMTLPEGVSLISQTPVTQNGQVVFSADNYDDISWSGYYWKEEYGIPPHWQGNLGLEPAYATVTLAVDSGFNDDLTIGYRFYYERPSEYRAFFDYGELFLQNAGMAYATVSGLLQAADTEMPLPGRQMRLFNDDHTYFALTGEDGNYLFDNVAGGADYKLTVVDEDIYYWNGEAGYMEIGEITGGQPYSFTYYMEPYEVKNEMTTDNPGFTPGEPLAFSLEIENNYKEIWGIQLDVPEGVNITGWGSFMSASRNDEVLPFDEGLSSDKMLVWKGIAEDGMGMFPAGILASANLEAGFIKELQGDVIFNYRIYYDDPGNFDQPLYDHGEVVLKNSEALGIFERNNPDRLTVFPNPGNGRITLNIDLETNEDVTVEIFDTRGMKVYRATRSGVLAGLNTIPVDLTALPEGLYILHAVTSGKRYYSKILLQD